MSKFNISLVDDVLQLSFGEPATGDEIVAAIKQQLPPLPGGSLIKVNGPCTLAGGFVIAAYLKPLYGTVAVFDPKLSKYIVCLSSEFPIGTLID